MGLTFVPGLPPLILNLRMPSTRNLGACYTVLRGFHHWFSVKWASSLVATSWCGGSISFLLLLHELSVLEIMWDKWICFEFCHFMLCV
jgi:hypothetical protein